MSAHLAWGKVQHIKEIVEAMHSQTSSIIIQ